MEKCFEIQRQIPIILTQSLRLKLQMSGKWGICYQGFDAILFCRDVIETSAKCGMVELRKHVYE
jgi:hypothetical protein